MACGTCASGWSNWADAAKSSLRPANGTRVVFRVPVRGAQGGWGNDRGVGVLGVTLATKRILQVMG